MAERTVELTSEDMENVMKALEGDDLPSFEPTVKAAENAMRTTSGQFRAQVKRVQFTDPAEPDKLPTTTITLVIEGRSAVEVAGNLSRYGGRVVTVEMRGYAEQLSLWAQDS